MESISFLYNHAVTVYFNCLEEVTDLSFVHFGSSKWTPMITAYIVTSKRKPPGNPL